jgi:hypothetical protein
MSDTISRVHQLEKLSDYRRFFHTKSYIQSKSRACKDEKKLADVCGYRNLNKFRVYRMAWDNLERPIPTRYLTEIGVDLATLRFTVELDGEDYEKALSLPFFPKQAIIRFAATRFSTFNFFDGTSEQEAIAVLKDVSKKSHLFCLINVDEIKTIFVQPDGFCFTKYYRPTIEIRKDYVIASKEGKNLPILL